MEGFVEYYLENREKELREKWKIIHFFIEENKEIVKENYYPISRLKEILKKSKKC